VQRAAAAAASSRGARETRELGFPLVIGLILILGLGLVFVARENRSVGQAPAVGEDHWHAAYTVYDCGDEVARFMTQTDPDGIHSHQDSVIHIHPFNSAAAGVNARMGVFLEAMGATVSRDGISGIEFGEIDAASGCGDPQAVIKIGRFEVAPELELVAVYDDDFDSIQFVSDREAFSIAKVPVGEDPPPPSSLSLQLLESSTGSDLISTGPVTATAPASEG